MDAFEKAVKRMDATKDPAERAKIKADIDKMPISGNELADAQQREHDRKEQDIKEFNEARNR